MGMGYKFDIITQSPKTREKQENKKQKHLNKNIPVRSSSEKEQSKTAALFSTFN